MTTAPGLLAQKAMLATVHVSMWTARRYDASVSEETNRRHNAVEDAGRYNKLLVHKQDIKDVKSIRTAARQRHYMLTQPWLDDGSRLLPASLYMRYASEMGILRNEYTKAADAFVANYPNILKRAQARLNGMFNPDDYPSPANIGSHFGFDIKVMPCPDTNDFRVDIAQEHLTTIKADFEDQLKKSIDATMLDTKMRVTKLVGHMVERLKAKSSDEGTRLFDSVVDNLRELVEILPDFNLTDDPQLTAITERIKAELCVTDMEVLRDNEDVRSQVTKAADKILTDVAAFMA